MDSPKITITIPDFLQAKTDTVAGTISLKELVRRSISLPENAPDSEEVALFTKDLQILIDRVFVEKVVQRAVKAGTIRIDNRSGQEPTK